MAGEGAQFAWLGLLKWSLAYTDGTSDGQVPAEMSAEDKAFLTKVMEEGIIDEGARMRAVLKNITAYLENPQSGEEGKEKEDELFDNLQELRDIVEQIDFARAFCSMNGLPFLLGLASEDSIPSRLREAAVSILATLTQNNPPVQISFCGESVGGLEKLASLFDKSSNDAKIRKKVLQAMSCAVRAHAELEEKFVSSAACRGVLSTSIKCTSNAQLQTKGVFTLRTLLVSDTSSAARVDLFKEDVLFPTVLSFATGDGNPSNDVSLREESLRLLGALKSSVLSPYGGDIRAAAKKRAVFINAITDPEEKSWHEEEIELWHILTTALSKKEDDDENSTNTAPDDQTTTTSIPLLLG